MITQKIIYDSDALFELRNGINALTDAVKVTLGPKGRNVLIEENNKKRYFTKDGFTVAENVSLENGGANLGAQILKQIAIQTNEEAGDGTTTSIILGASIFNETLKYITAGYNLNEIIAGIKKALKLIEEQLDHRKIDLVGRLEITKLARLAANGDVKIGEIVGQVYSKLGKDTFVIVEDSDIMQIEPVISEGFKLDSGYSSSLFLKPDETNLVKHENPLIVICNKKIKSVKDIIPLLEHMTDKNRSLILIAEEFGEEVLSTIIRNRTKNNIDVLAVKCPSAGQEDNEFLIDIAAFTGADLIEESNQLNHYDYKNYTFGSVDKAIVSKDETILTGTRKNNDQLKNRIEYLKKSITLTTSKEQKTVLNKRLSNLTNSAVIIKVGGLTEAEQSERKFLVEDSARAVKAALEDGIVAGGGTALLRSAFEVNENDFDSDTEKIGLEIIRNAVKEPIIQLAANAGKDGNAIVEKMMEYKNDVGYNVLTDDFDNLLSIGIFDPVKVVKLALNNAASIASILLNTDAITYGSVQNNSKLNRKTKNKIS